MKFDLTLIPYSVVDKKKKIKIPHELNKELANYIGIQLGDGNIHINIKKYENQISCTGHLDDEIDWYFNYLIPLIKHIFNVSPYIYKDKRPNKSSIKLMYRSKAIVNFLVRVINLPSGKKENCSIPQVIKQSDIEIKRCFLRGYADTDFSIAFSRRKINGLHKYPTISLGTPDKKLTREVVELIRELGFNPQFRLNVKKCYIEINGKENLEKWMKEVGFSSPKHLTKYEIWEKYGFCPPYTTLAQREEILSGNEELIKKYKEKLIKS